MKLWDIRDPSKATTFDAQNEVRDVQFSPFYPYYFASALENGNILIWDLRKAQPERRITAHNGLISCLAWHPTEKNTLASGGRDRVIKTWDLTIQGGKPSSTTQTIAFVGRLTWRPSSHGRPWHIASSAGSSDNAVHIWDTKHPFTPLASLVGARDVTTTHLWTENHNAMIASSKDGYIRIFDLSKHCYLPNRHMAATAIRFNVRNHLAMVHEPLNRKVNPVAMDAPKPDTSVLTAQGPGFTPLDPNSTPIGRFGDFEPPIITRPISAHSTACFSDDNFGFDTAVFQYLAENYKFQGLPIVSLCEHNAQVSSEVHQAQLVQMWNMLAMLFTPVEDFMGAFGSLSLGSTSLNAKNGDDKSSSVAGGEHTNGEKVSASGENEFGVNPAGVESSHAIPIEVVSAASTSAVHSGAASPPAGGMRSAGDMYSPMPDDWDLHLLDVPSAASLAAGGAASGANGHSHAHGAGASSGVSYGVPGDGFGGNHHGHHHHAFEHHQSGFTDHDFVEDFDQSRALGTMVGGVGGPLEDDDEDDGEAATMILDGGGWDGGLGAPGLSAGLLAGKSLSVGLGTLQAASALEAQQEWEIASVVHELLNYYEHNGDVQSCIFIGLVLEPSRAVAIEPQRMFAWMLAYMELLHRLQLWNCANSMAKYCHLDSIRNMSKQGTTVYTKCASCSKAILGNSGVYCENCKIATSSCAICRLPVKGSLVWCAGCGHGGHSHHLRQWFSTESQCPTGCGHICLLSSYTAPTASTSSTATSTATSTSVKG